MVAMINISSKSFEIEYNLEGGTQRLPRLVGPSVAKELLFTSHIVDGEEAARLGLVDKVVEQDDDGLAAYKKALDIAEPILANVRL